MMSASGCRIYGTILMVLSFMLIRLGIDGSYIFTPYTNKYVFFIFGPFLWGLASFMWGAMYWIMS